MLIFHATQIFDPKYILLGLLEKVNLCQYSVIKELAHSSDELLQFIVECNWKI